jgi:hypothetical protein
MYIRRVGDGRWVAGWLGGRGGGDRGRKECTVAHFYRPRCFRGKCVVSGQMVGGAGRKATRPVQ